MGPREVVRVGSSDSIRKARSCRAQEDKPPGMFFLYSCVSMSQVCTEGKAEEPVTWKGREYLL